MGAWLDKTFCDIDYGVAKFFHIIEANCGKLSTVVMKCITLFGELGFGMLLIACILCLFAKTRRTGCTIIFAIGISAVITLLIIKPLIERNRPFTDASSDYYAWWVNAGKLKESGYSFPSGHTTSAMAFALAIFIEAKRKKISLLIFIIPVLMASSRLYFMVHYFSDCIGGLLIGSLGAVIAYFVTNLIYNKTKGKFNKFVTEFSVLNLFKKKTVDTVTIEQE